MLGLLDRRHRLPAWRRRRAGEAIGEPIRDPADWIGLKRFMVLFEGAMSARGHIYIDKCFS